MCNILWVDFSMAWLTFKAKWYLGITKIPCFAFDEFEIVSLLLHVGYLVGLSLYRMYNVKLDQWDLASLFVMDNSFILSDI